MTTMKISKTIYNVLLTMCLASTLSSCNDWLDVQPKSQVEDSELFSSQQGYKEALAGVYSSMVSDNTYAKNLTFGAVAVLGQEWTDYPSSTYDDMAEFDYTTTYSKSLIEGIWKTNYNGIVNANNLLSHIDNSQKLFSGNNYSIIKGEALALRAFLHFDLLRCFGVSYAQSPDKPSIPYCTVMSYKVSPQLKVSEVCDKIIDDLKTAANLLQNTDPIATGKEITELEDNGYLMNRQKHLNYYAVRGLMARIYMWMGNYTEAENAAKEVINSKVFSWATVDKLSKGEDNSFATEQLFGLNDDLMSSISDNYFNPDMSSNSFSVDQQTLLNYYEQETSDYRYLYLFQSGVGELADYRFSTKFTESSGDDSYYTKKLPMIRLSEMYLILAECQYRKGEDALTTINDLRTARNIVSPLNAVPENFYDWLIKEYRREFLGEGQLFFLYKRLNMQSILGSDADMVAQKAYTFPLPISETDAVQRDNNR